MGTPPLLNDVDAAFPQEQADELSIEVIHGGNHTGMVV